MGSDDAEALDERREFEAEIMLHLTPYLVVLKHEPRGRYSYMGVWLTMDGDRIAAVTSTVSSFFHTYKKNRNTIWIEMTNLDTNEVQRWERGDKHVTFGLTSTRWSTDTKPITEDPTRKRLLEITGYLGMTRLIPQRKFLWFWLTYRNHPRFLNKETALLWLEEQ